MQQIVEPSHVNNAILLVYATVRMVHALLKQRIKMDALLQSMLQLMSD
jgi:hypothetical protein